MRDVEEKRRTVYSSDNEHHEALLMQVSEAALSAFHSLSLISSLDWYIVSQ